MSTPPQRRVLFIGEPGAGKSACITAISEIMPTRTDVATPEALSPRRGSPTVALDCGVLTTADGERLLLYGVPGQARFEFAVAAMRAGVVGVVLLVDHGAADARALLAASLERHREVLRERPFVVAINRSAGITRAHLDAYVRVLQQSPLVAPVLAIDARSRDSVSTMVDVLLEITAFAPPVAPARAAR